VGSFKKKIETIMRSNEKQNFFFVGSLLFFLSLGYAGVVQIRNFFYQHGVFKQKKLPLMVISIGNLTVGGTGKTPMTIYLAHFICGLGYKVAVISRGYKGSAEKTGGIVSDGRTVLMDYDTSGDEPFLMASKLKNVPVLVGQNRFQAGMTALEKFTPDVILLDDAFQHIKLKRDMNLLLLDYSLPFGNTHLLPRGILREPVSSLSRGDAFILTRSKADDEFENNGCLQKIKNLVKDKPVFKSFHVPYINKRVKGKNSTSESLRGSYSPDNFSFLKDHRVYAFSGIARNDAFKHTLEDTGCIITDFLEFSDHHIYTLQNIKTIIKLSNRLKAEFIITTQKDFSRLPEDILWPLELVVFDIRISFDNDDSKFKEFVKSRIEKFYKNRKTEKQQIQNG